jgi:hypothetical protein
MQFCLEWEAQRLHTPVVISRARRSAFQAARGSHIG